MGSNMKLAAERLLQIANDLEKEAADNTFFVCEGCNHTSSLSDINAKRKIAGESHKVKRVASVSVNDKVTCLACGDKMSYVSTETSGKYYVEAEDDGSDIFEPVDERETPEEETVPAPEDEGTVPETSEEAPVPAPEGEETVPETPEEAPVPAPETPEDEGAVTETVTETTEEAPALEDEETSEITDYDGSPTDDVEPSSEEAPVPETDPDSEEAPAVDDTEVPAPEEDSDPVTEETVPEGPTEDVVVDEESGEEEPINEDGVELPKKDVPKFEKIPKDASDPFWNSVAKYSV